MTHKVPFSVENIIACLCPDCPVQLPGLCASRQLKSAMDTLFSVDPTPEKTPALYCASVRASCEGLDFKQDCLCGGCEVFASYNLASFKLKLYFCRDGAFTDVAI